MKYLENGLVFGMYWDLVAFFFAHGSYFGGFVAEADADLGRNGMTFLVGISGSYCLLHVVYCQNNGAVLLKMRHGMEGRDIEYLVTHSTINDEPSTTGGLVSNSAS